MGAFKDLAGQRFGRLMVEERTHSIGKRVAWKCRCECGITKVTTSKLLLNGSSSSCGCLQKERAASAHRGRTESLIGSQIGHLLVLERLNEKKWGSDLFLCKCNACGDFVKYPSASLKSGSVIACGCKSALRPKLTISALEERLLALFPAREVTVDPASFKSATKVCNFVDAEYGVFQTSPRSLLHRKCRHPKFGIQKRGIAKRRTNIGEKIHLLTIKQYIAGTGLVDATCDCGTAIRVKLCDIHSGRIQSCGCLQSKKKSGRGYSRL